jgi:two-component system sensor histidine kinase/response regulator
MNPKDRIITSLQTAQDELEKALADLAQLPAFDASRVRFAAHTLNNYLTVTAATVDLLELHLKNCADEKVGIWLHGLRHATTLMTHLALQLMNAPAATGEQFVQERVDLPTLAQRACEYYRRVAEPKQITISFEPDAPAPYVWADRVAVAAVLDNLLSNAVKFSAPQKRVWVRVTAEPAHLVCTVQDEGPGLSVEEQSRLFQRGVRLNNAPTGGEPSTGYGLAVAKELIGKLDGELWCASQSGQGAAFSFRLPKCVEEPHAGAEK